MRALRAPIKIASGGRGPPCIAVCGLWQPAWRHRTAAESHGPLPWLPWRRPTVGWEFCGWFEPATVGWMFFHNGGILLIPSGNLT